MSFKLSNDNQILWANCLLCWFIVDIFINSTLHAIFINYIIPSCINNSINKSLQIINQALQSFKNNNKEKIVVIDSDEEDDKKEQIKILREHAIVLEQLGLIIFIIFSYYNNNNNDRRYSCG